MSIVLGFLTIVAWTVVPLALLIALVFFIVGLSTDDQNVKLRRQRLRMALLFGVIPLGGAIVLTLLTLIVGLIEGAALSA